VQQLVDNVWILKYPLKLLGLDAGRTVTVIRLRSGQLVIHSTAPFTDDEVARIRALGQPTWMLDATLFHDSFVPEGKSAFPDAKYLAPPAFAPRSGISSEPLSPAPSEWSGALEVLPLAGTRAGEHFVYHPPSRTLIVCDCLFNFGQTPSLWTRFVVRWLMGLKDGIGMSMFFRLMIRDRAAFKNSIASALEWDFERIVVGHGEVITRDARSLFRRELEARDLAP
jgi:hypothetical protein